MHKRRKDKFIIIDDNLNNFYYLYKYGCCE